MDSSDTFQFIILVILLLLSAFFSSAETALMTVNKIRLRSLADDGNRRAALVLDTTEKHTSKMLSAILIGNNIVNISKHQWLHINAMEDLKRRCLFIYSDRKSVV